VGKQKTIRKNVDEKAFRERAAPGERISDQTKTQKKRVRRIETQYGKMRAEPNRLPLKKRSNQRQSLRGHTIKKNPFPAAIERKRAQDPGEREGGRFLMTGGGGQRVWSNPWHGRRDPEGGGGSLLL